MSGTDLQGRVAAALRDSSTPSATLAGLLDKVDQAVQAASRDSRRAKQDAVDPLGDAKTIAAAWQAAERLDRDLARLESAADALRRALADAREAEQETARVERYDAALAERDDAVRALRERYPGLARQIAGLLAALEQAERAVATANQNLPAGASWLASAESLARGCSANLRVGASPVTLLVMATRLPALDAEASALGASLWPAAPGLTANRAA